MDKEKKTFERMTRRDFFKIGAAGAAFAGMASACSRKPGEAIVPRKALGKTGMMASIIGMGGGSALSMIKNDDEALALIDLARRKGINFFDSGSEYGGGTSETRFGLALKDYRKDVYLSTKYGPDSSPDILMKKFETTLSRFHTDYLDVANMHGLGKVEDVEKMFSSGALETLVKLKEQGVVKNISLTSHNCPPALVEAMKRFRFDVVLMAANASKVPFVGGEFEVCRRGQFRRHFPARGPGARDRCLGFQDHRPEEAYRQEQRAGQGPRPRAYPLWIKPSRAWRSPGDAHCGARDQRRGTGRQFHSHD